MYEDLMVEQNKFTNTQTPNPKPQTPNPKPQPPNLQTSKPPNLQTSKPPNLQTPNNLLYL